MSSNYIIHRESSPSALNRAVAPIARVWLRVQDTVANILGFKNSGNLAGAVTGLGLAGLVAVGMAPALAPLAAVSETITVAGVAGLVENKVTTTLAKSDEKRITRIA